MFNKAGIQVGRKVGQQVYDDEGSLLPRIDALEYVRRAAPTRKAKEEPLGNKTIGDIKPLKALRTFVSLYYCLQGNYGKRVTTRKKTGVNESEQLARMLQQSMYDSGEYSAFRKCNERNRLLHHLVDKYFDSHELPTPKGENDCSDDDNNSRLQKTGRPPSASGYTYRKWSCNTKGSAKHIQGEHTVFCRRDKAVPTPRRLSIHEALYFFHASQKQQSSSVPYHYYQVCTQQHLSSASQLVYKPPRLCRPPCHRATVR